MLQKYKVISPSVFITIFGLLGTTGENHNWLVWYHCKTLLILTMFSTFRCNPIVFYCSSFQSSCQLQFDFCTASLPPNLQAYLHLKLSHWESCLFFLEEISSWGLKFPFLLLFCINFSFCILSIYLPFLKLCWHLNILIFTSLHVPLYLLLLSALFHFVSISCPSLKLASASHNYPILVFC